VSTYIRILNKIKSSVGMLSLTQSQAICRSRIEERLVYPGIVNLHGARGTGKTFLGWKMAVEKLVVYVVHPSTLPEMMRETSFSGNTIAFVDNANEDRIAFRKLLIDLESAGNIRAIIVTRQPADDYVFRAELDLTKADIERVHDNWRRLGLSVDISDWHNLWYGLLLAAEVKL
jgi:hypothetical protein